MNETDWMSACISIWSYSTSKAYVYERRMNWIWCFHRSMWVMVMLPLFWAYVCISKFSLDILFLAKLVKVEKRPGARGVYVYVYVYCCLVWICYYVLTSYLICNCWVCTWTCGLSVGVCGMRALSELVHSCSNLDFGMWFVQCVWVWVCIVMCVLCMLVAPEILVPVGLTGSCFVFAVVAPTCVCCGLPATHPLRTKYRSHKHIILPFIFCLLLILLLFESPIILCMVAFICGLLCRSHWFQVSFVCARMWCLLHMLVSNRSNVVAVRVVGCCVFVCYSFSVERVSSCVFGLSECVWVCVKE